MSAALSSDYFKNHGRRDRFPWSLYHRELTHRIAAVVGEHATPGRAPRVLIVGCGLETRIEGAPPTCEVFGCDLDARAVEACRAAEPSRQDAFAVCPGPFELPRGGPFDEPFDVVLAKEVVEHVTEPTRWATALAARVRVGGTLLLSTPNYGRFSTLPLLESTVLEWIARRDGFSRKHIHPTRFDKGALEALDVGRGMKLVTVTRTLLGWSLLGRWRRTA